MTKGQGRLALDDKWLEVLSRTGTAPEVVQLCVTFLSHWAADLRSGLGPDCQPPLAMRSADDVAEYAFRLVQMRLRESRPTPELDAMTTFFAAAAMRLAHVLSVPPSRAFKVPFFTREAEEE
ncbi:MAG TPA: hypothetical protein VH301_14695 [Usitatibacter sp.]|nr:hypothetical protein [Usitatibacter sp.]